MEDQLVYLTLAAAFGLFMAWGIGANDVANAMATSIGSGALTIRQALVVAAVFEFAGAVLAGGEVTSTIRRGIIDASFVANEPGPQWMERLMLNNEDKAKGLHGNSEKLFFPLLGWGIGGREPTCHIISYHIISDQIIISRRKNFVIKFKFLNLINLMF